MCTKLMKRADFFSKGEITKDLLPEASFANQTELMSTSCSIRQYKTWLLAGLLVNSQMSLLFTKDSSNLPSFSATIAFTL